MIQKYVFKFENHFFEFLLQRKRGRPPKTKSSDGPTPIANYTKHPHINPPGIPLTNPVLLNDQLIKVNKILKIQKFIFIFF
jgi:hypothetical protein